MFSAGKREREIVISTVIQFRPVYLSLSLSPYKIFYLDYDLFTVTLLVKKKKEKKGGNENLHRV